MSKTDKIKQRYRAEGDLHNKSYKKLLFGAKIKTDEITKKLQEKLPFDHF